ncbi:hypothetical protein OX284_004170 [Flavobacterium sp. SUN046]|uniref:hypothetical protein n=1 Tax=Flavobacterium sp. SUN046 TaxID=3002440 RepID=UPI002DBF7A91|nr:hypothetical protein [Flavobacterium sp. SUN046]MEC4048614.1 hypothetical protein [Flavobacterium sp. SUN046]
MMKLKYIYSILILLIAITSSCQSTKNITFESFENSLIDFLIKKGEIMEHQVNDFKNKKYTIHVIGAKNGYNRNNLINGIYTFSSGFSHTRTYYLIIENDKYVILDISSREGLEISIKSTLDFCERQKYCSDITQEYISKLVGVYYTRNKNPIVWLDTNCESGVKETKDLP